MSQSKERVLQVYPRMAVVKVEDDWWVVFDDSAKIAKAVRIGCGMTEDAALDDAASKLPHPEPPLCKCGHERDGEFGHDVEGAGNCGGNNGTCPCTKYEPPSPAGEIASEPEPVPAEGAAEVKPCPFCGARAELRKAGMMFLASCTNLEGCPVFPNTECLPREQDALSAWNRRAPSAPEAVAAPAFYVIERTEGTPTPLYMRGESGSWTHDIHAARKWDSHVAAEFAWRNQIAHFRNSSAVVEHAWMEPSAPEAAAGPGTKLTIDDCTSDEILQGEECAAAIDDDELRAVLAQTEAILLHCERRLSAAPIAPADESTATSERLLRAINWAMGCGPDDFRSVRHDAPRFWWRSELAERAGLEYDGEKYVIRPTPPVREQP